MLFFFMLRTIYIVNKIFKHKCFRFDITNNHLIYLFSLNFQLINYLFIFYKSLHQHVR